MARLSVCRVVMVTAMVLAVFELFVINVAILYIFSIHAVVKQEVDGFLSSKGSLLERLKQMSMIKGLIFQGKDGGFASLMKHSLDRVIIVSERSPLGKEQQASQFERSDISYLSLDVSSDGETLYLIRRMKQRGAAFSQTYTELVIDIGANDGLLGSNSFNLIQLGWKAILVEPQETLLRIAQRNVKRYVDPYNEQDQHKVILVNAVLGEHDGSESFVLMEEDTESFVLNAKRMDTTGKLVVSVPSMTVETFAKKYQVPSRFGILSIDAEGVGDKVLHHWIDQGFEPAYIVYEALHNKEPIEKTSAYLRQKGYRFLNHVGWNYIFEHQPESGK